MTERKQSADAGPIRFAWIPFSLMGVAAIGFGLYSIVSNSVFWAQAETATGTIVGFERMEGIRRSGRTVRSVDRAKANVVSFRVGAEEHIFVTEWGSEAAVYDQGETVTVLYRADDPDDAKVRGFVSLYVGPLLTLLLGAGLGVAGLLAKFMAT